MRPLDGSDWLVPASAAGEPWTGDNPRICIPMAWHEFVRFWAACRGEHGIATWPDAGGLGDQAAWIVDAFATLSGVDSGWREAERKARA